MEYKPVTFRSKFASFRMVLDQKKRMMVNNEFVITPGLTVEFNRGEFATDDQALIARLRKHHEYGHNFFELTAGDKPADHAPEAVRKAMADAGEPPVVVPKKKTGHRASTMDDVVADKD